MRTVLCCCALLFLALGTGGYSQTDPKRSADVFVDQEGVLRWKDTNGEVSLFGVNYTTPFAYSYRAHKRLGLSLKKAIDLDVAQLARLDLDAFRVHVWDREISDAKGNLLSNDHVDLFDYLLAKLADRGVKIIITPIAWWGNGWPEPDEMTKGFSQSYSKAELITDQKARGAQRNYLRQFVDHINPYRNIAYKMDPSIIAMEIVNEPRHPEDGKATTDYVNEMAGVLRGAGYAKPIFYNISENWNDVQANAVTGSNADGVSFQWYPTDLVHGRMLKGNYLINVNKYAIPSENVDGFKNKAKMVYEFDAADVGGSYMYPAMARSFREAGMQFATMFSYDPVQIAWSNTEYPTHYVNLLYAPSKAISLMIAAKAFRRLPRMKSFGTYPENNRFGDFRVSDDEDVSEMNTASEFIYSNSTQSRPQNIDSVTHVAGCGNSMLVRYDGTGAYFLDRLERGMWRLEVYPDVLWLRDPFERTSMSRQVARLLSRERKMSIALPDLGEDYTVRPMSRTRPHNSGTVRARDYITPGVFLVTAKAVDVKRMETYLSKAEPFLDDLYTPPAVTSGITVVNKTSQYSDDSSRIEFRFQIASEHAVTSANVYIRRFGWRGFAELPLKNVGGFDFVAVDTSAATHSGRLEYCVAVESGDTTLTFPGGIPGNPGRWDFSSSALWILKIVEADEPVVLLDVSRDRNDLVFPHYSKTMKYTIEYKNGSNSEEVALCPRVTFSREAEIPFGIQLNVSEHMKAVSNSVEGFQQVKIKARSVKESTCTVGINFLMSDGRSYRSDIELGTNWNEIGVPLAAFRSGSALILPDAYPLFLPKTWKASSVALSVKPDLRSLQSIQIVVDPANVAGSEGKKETGFAMVSVRLEK
jgi:hypothetical protein